MSHSFQVFANWTVVYPGLSLGTTFFAKQNQEADGGLRVWGMKVKPPGKTFIFTFRESSTKLKYSLNWQHQV